jgi:RHS repeat-associated protein
VPLIGRANRNFTYDAENRQVTATITGGGTTTASYLYDGLGQRVSKTVNGVTTTYVYDAFGNLAAEYGPAEASPCLAATCYVTVDHLGSTRMLTDNNGVVQKRYDYQPFGAEIPAGYGGRTTGMLYQTAPDDFGPKFTSQSRDPETVMDWFNVRHMSGAQGRFQSPDPGNAGADASDPQTWNMYAYVGNNPLSYTDPTGEFGEATEIGGDFGPIGAAIGAAVDIGLALFGIFESGGSGPPPALANFPFPNGVPNATPSGGPLGPGSVFGDGDTGPFTFSLINPNSPGLLVGKDALAWIWGYGINLVWGMRHPGPTFRGFPTGPTPTNPTPRRYFGTYYCGPGGAGPRTGVANGACAVHDECFGTAGINADGNTNPSIVWTTAQVAAARSCNQGLYDAVKDSNDAGATGIKLWLRYGESFRILRQGTAAHP